MADNTFEEEKSWSNVQGSRSKPRKWKQSEGVNHERAEQAQAGVNKSIGDTLSETWEQLKKIPSDIKKGLNK